MKRLTLKERMEHCAIHIPQNFVYYVTPMGVIPPFARIQTHIPTVWATLRPDITEWVKTNIRKKARIIIRDRWVETGEEAVTKSGSIVRPKTIDGMWLIFDDQKDAALFKLFWM